MSHSKKIGKKLIMEHYHRGRADQRAGRAFAAPSDSVLRRSYSEGYADEIMGIDPTEDEILFIVQG